MMPRTAENFSSNRVLVLSSGAVKRISRSGSTETQNEVVATLGTKIMSNIRALALRLDSNSQLQSEFTQGPTACYGGEPTVTLSLVDSANNLHAAMQHATCKAVTVDSIGVDANSSVKSLNKVGYAIKQLYDFLQLTSSDLASVRP